MKESLYGISRNLIFRETFNSQSDTEKNGGTVTDVTYSNGVGSFNGTTSKIAFTNRYGVKSVRLIITLNSTTENILKLSATQSISAASGTLSATGFSTPSVYVNGSLSSTITTDKAEIVITTATAFNADDIILGYISAYGTFTVDLIEIYNTALTAEQVSNIYNKTTYRDIRDGLILDIDARGGSIIDRIGHNIVNSSVVVKRNNTLMQWYAGTASNYLTVPTINFGTIHTLSVFLKIENNCIVFGGTAPVSFMTFYLTSVQYKTSGTNYVSTTLDIINDGKFHHVIISRSGLTVSFYSDGVLVGSGTLASNDDLIVETIGGFTGYASYHVKGYMNQIRVYNRALSAEEVAQLYTMQKVNYE